MLYALFFCLYIQYDSIMYQILKFSNAYFLTFDKNLRCRWNVRVTKRNEDYGNIPTSR